MNFDARMRNLLKDTRRWIMDLGYIRPGDKYRIVGSFLLLAFVGTVVIEHKIKEERELTFVYKDDAAK